jgi:peptidoglycan hydrolase-like protein with peptidoglycan-binding domain
MAENGRLSASELAPIPGGELRKDAAAAWNAPGGPADAGLRPTGSRSSYRTYAEQEYFWNLYQSGAGALAAYPGTSNHGWGIAVDLAEPWMRDWIDAHGAKYGWRKTEAMSEWWHVNYVGGVSFPTFKVLKHGMRGPRVVKFTRRLAFIRKRNGGRYLHRQFWKFKDPVVEAVRAFQKTYHLKVDGEIGPKTAAKINGVFKRQYRKRGK